ncbi:mycoredoxin [Corynebacterium bovis]|uniref:mycoredoxin n=1 Tax=Corynebacterium bovis TaxID=36808 RepID=UPI00254A8D89|nr:mycoredoxin [Corynebacterium bovis]MDK8511125.1 mycoredoxin [Corynebacterium bovis]
MTDRPALSDLTATYHNGAAEGDDTVILYTTTWCPFCSRLTRALDRTGTPYTRVDVEDNPTAGRWVESVNGGNRVVPTVHFADGSHATNPPASAVRQWLEGHRGE